jgi:hypothetical protein
MARQSLCCLGCSQKEADSGCEAIALRYLVQRFVAGASARLEFVWHDNFYKVFERKSFIVPSLLYLGHDSLSYLETDC